MRSDKEVLKYMHEQLIWGRKLDGNAEEMLRLRSIIAKMPKKKKTPIDPCQIMVG